MHEPSGIAATLKPPYYTVIFTSLRAAGEDDGYAETAERMLALAAEQPGFLGVESAHEGAMGITVSYWSSTQAIARWKRQTEHSEAQATGRRKWYSAYKVRVALVERDYGFDAGQESGTEQPSHPRG